MLRTRVYSLLLLTAYDRTSTDCNIWLVQEGFLQCDDSAGRSVHSQNIPSQRKLNLEIITIVFSPRRLRVLVHYQGRVADPVWTTLDVRDMSSGRHPVLYGRSDSDECLSLHWVGSRK